MPKSSSESKEKRVKSRDYEIDIVELLTTPWSKKWFISKMVGLSLVLGLTIAFSSPSEYQTTAILIPEIMGEDSKLGGSLGGLASLAGVDLGDIAGGSNQVINPALYQSVSRSTPLLLDLMSQEYFFSELGDTISLHDYYLDHMEVNLLSRLTSIPSRLVRWVKKPTVDSTYDQNLGSDIVLLGQIEKGIIENLAARVLVEMDWELNLLTISVKMQDPFVAAQMAKFTQEYITKYVTTYSVSKSKQQLESITYQFSDRKKQFEKAQYNLAAFRDANQNVITSRSKSEEDRLQSEYDLAFNIFNQLAQQREAIKLQIEKNTPVFTVLEPVIVPTEKSSPKRRLIALFSILVGVFLGVGVIISKKYLISFFSES